MKTFGIFLLLFVASASAQSSSSAYPIAVTVQGSSVVDVCDVSQGSSLDFMYMKLSVIIEGRHLELRGNKPIRNGILALGEYKAKLVTDKHEKPYVSDQVYELQYPDGATERFTVTGETK